MPVAARLPDAPDAPDGTEGARLLLVEDNSDMRDYVQRLLGRRWRVEAVGDGQAALAAARRAPPDLVVSDVMMPLLDGYGLLRALRGDERLSAIPVILLSARAGSEAQVEGLEAGANDYVSKPFSARELLARVSTQLQLARARAEVARSGERLRQLLMQAPVAVCVLKGREHRFELANPRFLAMVDRDDVAGQRLDEGFPELAAALIGILDRVYDTGEPFSADDYVTPLERDGVIADGAFSFNLVPTRDASGAIDGIMAIAAETTEQVRARALTQQARLEAETANRAKDEFLAMLGHELRNPLAPIMTALELMRLRPNRPVERERAIIERQAQHMARLVDDLLDVSRITRGKIELDRRPVELAELTAKALETAAPLFEKLDHQVTTDVAQGLVVDGDNGRLVQVISNLLTNAAKYTDAGGRITIRGGREGGEVVLRIADSGRGISPEMIPRLFELFTQEQQNLDRSRGGLGLGLAIVRSLVHLHGGTVAARSDGLGLGSELVIRLPASSRSAAPAPLTVVQGDAVAPQTQRARILIVDDNADALDLLAEGLAQLGYETHTARDGAEALAVAERIAAPQVALLDIGLPAMDGYELAGRLRRQSGWSNVCLIALTGYGQQSDHQRSLRAGFDHHLVKPIRIEQLGKLLSGLLAPAGRLAVD